MHSLMGMTYQHSDNLSSSAYWHKLTVIRYNLLRWYLISWESNKQQSYWKLLLNPPKQRLERWQHITLKISKRFTTPNDTTFFGEKLANHIWLTVQFYNSFDTLRFKTLCSIENRINILRSQQRAVSNFSRKEELCPTKDEVSELFPSLSYQLVLCSLYSTHLIHNIPGFFCGT